MRRLFATLALITGMIVGSNGISSAQQLPVKILALTSPVKRGAVARLAIHTSPGAQCSPVLEIKPGTTATLGKRTADAKGNVQWSWKVGPDASLGSRPLSITCALKDKVSIAQLSLVVR